jgi:hypothetical protein
LANQDTAWKLTKPFNITRNKAKSQVSIKRLRKMFESEEHVAKIDYLINSTKPARRKVGDITNHVTT